MFCDGLSDIFCSYYFLLVRPLLWYMNAQEPPTDLQEKRICQRICVHFSALFKLRHQYSTRMRIPFLAVLFEPPRGNHVQFDSR